MVNILSKIMIINLKNKKKLEIQIETGNVNAKDLLM